LVDGCSAHWFPSHWAPVRFCTKSSSNDRPVTERSRVGSSSHDSRFLQSSFVDLPLPAFRLEALPARVSSLSAISLKESTFREDSGPRCVPPSGFLSPSTVCSSFQLCGLVSSRNRAQGSSLPGLVPIFSAFVDSSSHAASLSVRPLPSRACAHVRVGIFRLRGVVPKIDREPSVWFCPLRWFASLPSFLLQVFPFPAVGAIPRVIRS